LARLASITKVETSSAQDFLINLAAFYDIIMTAFNSLLFLFPQLPEFPSSGIFFYMLI